MKISKIFETLMLIQISTINPVFEIKLKMLCFAPFIPRVMYTYTCTRVKARVTLAI